MPESSQQRRLELQEWLLPASDVHSLELLDERPIVQLQTPDFSDVSFDADVMNDVVLPAEEALASAQAAATAVVTVASLGAKVKWQEEI